MIENQILEDRIRGQIRKLEEVKKKYEEFSRAHSGYLERINGIDIQVEALECVLAGKELADSWEKSLERDKREEGESI